MIDIVIPVYKAFEHFKACVHSVREYTTDYRFIIVDDYSEQNEITGFLNELRRALPMTVVITHGKQRWFTRAANSGLRLVRTPRAVLLNSDVVVNRGWLHELEAVWNEIEKTAKKVGCVGSVHTPGTTTRWEEPTEPNYVTMHAVLLNMKALTEVADKRGTSGWYFDETRNDSIHIRSDRFLSYDMNRLGYTTAISFQAIISHIDGGGKSWSHNLGSISNLRVEDLE